MNRPFNLLKIIVRITPPIRFEYSVTSNAIEFPKPKLQF